MPKEKKDMVNKGKHRNNDPKLRTSPFNLSHTVVGRKRDFKREEKG